MYMRSPLRGALVVLALQLAAALRPRSESTTLDSPDRRITLNFATPDGTLTGGTTFRIRMERCISQTAVACATTVVMSDGVGSELDASSCTLESEADATSGQFIRCPPQAFDSGASLVALRTPRPARAALRPTLRLVIVPGSAPQGGGRQTSVDEPPTASDARVLALPCSRRAPSLSG